MTKIDPKKITKIENSPVQRSLAILDKLFFLAPQPRVNSAAARNCGELLGRHLLNLLRSCGELNLMGFHSSAISLFRPLEDALDCLAAVTIIAGAAERWQLGELKPSDAAKLWHRRLDIYNAKTGDIELDYRKKLRTIFNNFSHCTPMLSYWDLFRNQHYTHESLSNLKVNHENSVIEFNAYRIDAFLVAHCSESLDVIEIGYVDYFDEYLEVKEELRILKKEITKILRKQIRDGLLDRIVPLEIENFIVYPIQNMRHSEVEGKWEGHWHCSSGSDVKYAKPTLRQEGPFVSGSLTIQMRSDGQLIKVIEQISGIAYENKLVLDGISSEILPFNKKWKYQLDTFELEYSNEKTELRGIHKCDFGEGNSVFKRV